MPKTYLGDSVYVDDDGWGMILTTENGLNTDPGNKIYLEPLVMEALIKFYEAWTIPGKIFGEMNLAK